MNTERVVLLLVRCLILSYCYKYIYILLYTDNGYIRTIIGIVIKKITLTSYDDDNDDNAAKVSFAERIKYYIIIRLISHK